MNIKLQRESLTELSTAGTLYVNDAKECFTLEDKMRQVEGRPVQEWKVKAETAIPIGTYKVIIAPSPKRGGRLMPLLLNVPGFTGIQIHSGNTNEDTEGCILLGVWRENADTIRGSKLAFDKFFVKLLAAFNNDEEIYIEVLNP